MCKWEKYLSLKIKYQFSKDHAVALLAFMIICSSMDKEKSKLLRHDTQKTISLFQNLESVN